MYQKLEEIYVIVEIWTVLSPAIMWGRGNIPNELSGLAKEILGQSFKMLPNFLQLSIVKQSGKEKQFFNLSFFSPQNLAEIQITRDLLGLKIKLFLISKLQKTNYSQIKKQILVKHKIENEPLRSFIKTLARLR